MSSIFFPSKNKTNKKSTSFWNPITIKSVKPFLSPKFIQPINLKSYPTRTKQENKLINKNPFGDRDRDKVPNIFDCKPLNNKLQGWKYKTKEEADAAKKARQQTPEYKAHMKAYYQIPENKEKIKARNQTPERKAYRETYQQSLEYKARKKEYDKIYYQTPEYIAKEKERNQKPERKVYLKKYYQTPERKAYDKARYKLKKLAKTLEEKNKEEIKKNISDFELQKIANKKGINFESIKPILSGNPALTKPSNEIEKEIRKKVYDKTYQTPEYKAKEKILRNVKDIQEILPDLEFDKEYRKEQSEKLLKKEKREKQSKPDYTFENVEEYADYKNNPIKEDNYDNYESSAQKLIDESNDEE